jgi:hypothetical protein
VIVSSGCPVVKVCPLTPPRQTSREFPDNLARCNQMDIVVHGRNLLQQRLGCAAVREKFEKGQYRKIFAGSGGQQRELGEPSQRHASISPSGQGWTFGSGNRMTSLEPRPCRWSRARCGLVRNLTSAVRWNAGSTWQLAHQVHQISKRRKW